MSEPYFQSLKPRNVHTKRNACRILTHSTHGSFVFVVNFRFHKYIYKLLNNSYIHFNIFRILVFTWLCIQQKLYINVTITYSRREKKRNVQDTNVSSCVPSVKSHASAYRKLLEIEEGQSRAYSASDGRNVMKILQDPLRGLLEPSGDGTKQERLYC